MSMRIDNSQLQTFVSCPKKFYNKYKLCLKKIHDDEDNIYLNWGKALHAALEVWYTTHSLESTTDHFIKNYIPLANDKVRTTAHGLQLLKEYVDYYSHDTNELGDQNLRTVAVETVGEYLIKDLAVVVKIDRIAENNAGRWVIDHKFTSKSLYTFINTFSPNMQVSNYVNYVRKTYGQCSGFIPDVVQYGYREKMYKGEPAGFWWKPERDIICRNQEQLDDFEQQFYTWAMKIKEAEERNCWPKNESACSMCPFKELCLNLDDEMIKESLYEICNPFEYLEEKK